MKCRAITTQGHARRVDRLHRAHGVAFDAGHLNQPADRIAGQPEVVLHADLGGVLDLLRGAAEHFAQRAGAHGTGHAHLALAADFGPGNRGVLLVEDSDRSGGEQEAHHAVLVCARDEAHVVMQQRRNDACRAIGRRGDHAPAAGILLVDRQRIEVDPVEDIERVAQVGLGMLAELAVKPGSAAAHLEPAGHHAFGAATGIDAILHDLPDAQQSVAGLCFRPPGGFVGQHQLADAHVLRGTVIEQFSRAVKGVRQRGGILDDAVAAGGLLVDDEAAAHRVVLAAAQLQTGGVEGAEHHAVGMERQRPANEGELSLAVEGNRMPAEQLQFATLADRREAGRDAVGIHRFGLLALQSEQHGPVTAVALAGSAERAVQLDPEAGSGGQQFVALQPVGEAPCGAHGADGVRAGRADADLEQVEDAEGHGVLRGRACISLDRSAVNKVDRDRSGSLLIGRRLCPLAMTVAPLTASRPRGWPPGCCARRSRPGQPGRWRH